MVLSQGVLLNSKSSLIMWERRRYLRSPGVGFRVCRGRLRDTGRVMCGDASPTVMYRPVFRHLRRQATAREFIILCLYLVLFFIRTGVSTFLNNSTSINPMTMKCISLRYSKCLDSKSIIIYLIFITSMNTCLLLRGSQSTFSTHKSFLALDDNGKIKINFGPTKYYIDL